MTTHNWLSLMEYSAKYRVSLSTLRRRIKTGELDFKLLEGKYMLKDGPLQMISTSGPETIAPPTSVSSRAQKSASVAVEPKAEVEIEEVELETAPAPAPEKVSAVERESAEDRHWQSTQTLLSEIKRAYSLVLQEKEEQILQLKEEVADLKTLVRVLEDENNRVKNLQPKLDFDLGLEV